jgi:hypothetical protein
MAICASWDTPPVFISMVAWVSWGTFPVSSSMVTWIIWGTPPVFTSMAIRVSWDGSPPACQSLLHTPVSGPPLLPHHIPCLLCTHHWLSQAPRVMPGSSQYTTIFLAPHQPSNSAPHQALPSSAHSFTGYQLSSCNVLMLLLIPRAFPVPY